MIPTLHKRPNDIKPIRLLWLSVWSGPKATYIIVITMLLAPLTPSPLSEIQWHGAQTLCVELGAVILLMTMLSRPLSVHTFRSATLVLPLAFLDALLLWGLFSFASANIDSFATQGLLLLASEALVVHVVAQMGQTQQNYLLLADTLMGAGLLVAFSGLVLYSNSSAALVVGVLHDHMLFGAFLMLIFPISLGVSIAPVTPVRRIFAQTTLLICIIGLLMAQTRSSWIGGSIALITFGLLLVNVRNAITHHTYAPNARRQQFLSRGLIAALIIVSVLIFIMLSPERESVLARAKTLTTTVTQGKDESTQWRINAWKGDQAMIYRKPLMGWGIGSYPRCQYPFTHMGHSNAFVTKQGPTILDEAHNSYLQFGVEIGLPGLILWMAFLASVFIYGIPGLRYSATGSLEQRLMIGGLSAIAGQIVDAFANPAWQFGQIALPLWVILGVVISLGRNGKYLNSSSPMILSRVRQTAQLIFALLVGLILLYLIAKTAFVLPAPYL